MADLKGIPSASANGIPPTRVLVTGATGFIGLRLVRQLLVNGFNVTAVLRPGRAAADLPATVRPVHANLLDVSALREAARDATRVIHLAGVVRGRAYADFAPVNVHATGTLVEALAGLTPSPPLLHISSLAARFAAVSHYGASKLAGEDRVSEQPIVPWTILRPPAVYGPGDRELKPLLSLLARGIVIIPGNPDQRLSFLHVDDLTSACIAWLRDPSAARHRTFTIDDGRQGGYDWRAIAAAGNARQRIRLVVPRHVLALLGKLNVLLSGLTGQQPMLSPGKVRELTQDDLTATGTEGNAAWTAATGWQPTWSLAEGIRNALAG
ncbi:MAG: NAD(P)-dependent oxidoreductase [Pseudomonadales bacterium]|nr:NAD(P)-dependent oxidoreductase [Pseudomonadales bacterium]